MVPISIETFSPVSTLQDNHGLTPRNARVSSVYDFAPVRVRRIRRSQEYVARRYFHRFARPPHRRIGTELGHLFSRKAGRDERRPDRSRCDAIDANPALDHLTRE